MADGASRRPTDGSAERDIALSRDRGNNDLVEGRGLDLGSVPCPNRSGNGSGLDGGGPRSTETCNWPRGNSKKLPARCAESRFHGQPDNKFGRLLVSPSQAVGGGMMTF